MWVLGDGNVGVGGVWHGCVINVEWEAIELFEVDTQ